MIFMDTIETLYPDRYYATADTDGTVNGWYDMWDLTAADSLPSASELTPVPVDLWGSRNGYYKIVNGKLVNYIPPTQAIPLKTQATAELATARTYVYNNYGILNEDTPTEWVTYIKALMAISNGTDTTSTALPTQPTDVMTTSAASTT